MNETMNKIRRTAAVILSLLLILPCIPGYSIGDNSAAAAVVTELSSGRVLYSKSADRELPMASTTKIMTAYVALKYGTLSDVVEVSEAAASTEGSSMYLEKGEHITLENLLYGLMLLSGNDAAVAISEAVGGSTDRFVEMMNETAADMGLSHTHFDNPNGLPSDTHYTTASELAEITRNAYLELPKFKEIVSTAQKTVPWEGKDYNREMTNHNKLLGTLDGCVGVKTGYTVAAGRCLVSAVERNGMTLICVTLNDQNDWVDHTNLHNELFAEYHLENLTDTDRVIDKITAAGGLFGYTGVCADKTYTFPICDEDKYEIKTELDDDLTFPITSGSVVGSGQLLVNGEVYGNFNLIAADDINLIMPSGENFWQDVRHDISSIFSYWGQLINSFKNRIMGK